MREWGQRFLESRRRGGTSASTLESYGSLLGRFEAAGLDLAGCSAVEIEGFLDGMAGKSRSYGKLCAIVIRMVLRFLGREELLGAVPVPRIGDRAGVIQSKVLSDEDVERLIRGLRRFRIA